MDTTSPPGITDRSAWYGADLVQRTDWIEHLSDAEIGEVEDTARRSFDFTRIDPNDIPLPTLAPWPPLNQLRMCRRILSLDRPLSRRLGIMNREFPSLNPAVNNS